MNDAAPPRADLNKGMPPLDSLSAAPERSPAVAALPGATPATPVRGYVPLWAIAVAIGIAAFAVVVYVPRHYIASTDDAYVQADVISIVAKVGGYVTALNVTDNTRFAAGALLVQIDERDFQTALDGAIADLHSAEAASENVQRLSKEQEHLIDAARAAIDGDRAAVTFATLELARYARLAANGAGSSERSQQAETDLSEKRATLRHDLESLEAAQAHLAVEQSEIRQAEAQVARQKAAVAQARLNLSYTRIYAVRAGTVANRTVQVANYVEPGETLFSAVPMEVYVIANFKETQLTRMHPGQPATVRVDAYPGMRLRGHVDSLQRGTGADFALLPPENATGNFVKIVQRVPVKIVLDGPQELRQSISPGMSVEVSVTFNEPPVWLKPMFRWAVASAESVLSGSRDDHWATEGEVIT
jgi:membrane fusion protein (multidrug efflux system)